jgi:hypothetical protein
MSLAKKVARNKRRRARAKTLVKPVTRIYYVAKRLIG